MTSTLDWNRALREQWEFHWNHQVRDRLAGLTDDEYTWSPVPDPWNVRPRGGPEPQFGTGEHLIAFAFPTPSPEPFTTIAWRLGHVIVGVLAMRNATHFGGAPASYEGWAYAGTAKEALAQLDTELEVWLAGVAELDEAALATPVGPKEPGHEDAPMADLVLHIHRELIHHLSEVCLLRDLYLHTRRGETA